uniref:Wsv293a-like protein n=1 Tax=Trachysalambria curvirostris majanivirus TaxID=2984281 RepID=A0A9C7BMW1_9VIRU|nr:MAG: wsv293a-like protein [Trachysalambria curvirostris majanivirus]
MSNYPETINVTSPNERDNSSLSTFNDNVHFYLGPMFKEVANIIEEDKHNTTIDRIFIIIFPLLIMLCSGTIIYRMILLYNQISLLTKNQPFKVSSTKNQPKAYVHRNFNKKYIKI